MRSWRAVAAVAAAIVAGVAAGAVFGFGIDRTRTQPPPANKASQAARATAQLPSLEPVVAWFRDNVAPGTTVLVPPQLAPGLAAELSNHDVIAFDRASGRQVDLVLVGTGASRPRAGTPAHSLAASATAVARLRDAGLEMRQVAGVAGPDEEFRVAAARELLENPALSFSSSATTALAQGQVDDRVLLILAGLAADHELAVDLPRAPTDVPGVRLRTILVTKVDGRAVVDRGAEVIREFVKAQQGLLAGPVVEVRDPANEEPAQRGVAVRYLLPSPGDVFTGGALPTTSQETS